MYWTLIETVINIVKNYGADILSDAKFWYILTDSYSFGNEYSLRDVFRNCINTGYVSKLVSLRGNSEKTKMEIKHIVEAENKLKPGKKQEYAAVLFSIAIAISSCTKTDYTDFINPNSRQRVYPPIPKPIQDSESKCTFTDVMKVVFIIIMGVVILTGSVLSYGFFFFGDASMFGLLFVTGFFQVGYCVILNNLFWSKIPCSLKGWALACFTPMIIGLIVNSIIPLFLCSDSISDAVYTHFSSGFIPESYHAIADERALYESRLSPSVGFWGVLASIVLFVSLVSCGYLSKEYKDKHNLRFRVIDKISATVISAIIILNIVLTFLIPSFKVERQRAHYEIIEDKNRGLHQERKDIVQDLTLKGIKLGAPGDTAWEYLNNMEEAKGPLRLFYNKTIKHPDAIYDEFTGTSYNGIFPYEIPPGDFNGVTISGDDYKIYTRLDDTFVGLDLYVYDGLVSAMKITGISNSDKSLSNFESLLSLYTKKYGEPEIIEDYSRREDLFTTVLRKNDRYIWNFKNGRIEMSEMGIMYISDTLINKVRNESANWARELEIKAEQDKIRKEQADSLKREQAKRDSIRRILNHQNAINEI